MPELPEVEFAARRLRAWAVDRTVTAAEARPGSPLRDIEPDALCDGLTGRRFEAIRRHGKLMLIDLSGGMTLLSHLGMTGKWLRSAPADTPRSGTRVQLGLDDGHRLDYVDPRRFGHLRLLPTAEAARHKTVAGLGPDALEACATPGALAEHVGWSKRAIKVALMDQALIAGVGNIYAAEALWMAGINPFTRACDVKADDFARLARAITRTMTESLARERDDEIRYIQDRAAQNPFEIYGRTDGPCPTCGATIIRALQQQRSTFYCPVCQPARG